MRPTLPRVLLPLALACGGTAIESRSGTPIPPEPVATPGPVGASVYHLSPRGSDADPGSASRPWRTLRHALPRLAPGDTLYLRAGTYEENVRNPRIEPGRPGARITVAAYPGERPVVRGLLWLARPSYWTLDGINVTWDSANRPTSHMVKMTDGTGWVLQNAELWGARSYAALLVVGSTRGEPAHWTVRGNCIHDTHPSNDTSQDHNVYVNTGTSAGPGLVERNVIFGAPNGSNVKLGYGRSQPAPGDGTANVTVRYNTMSGGQRSLMVTDESHHNVIERNIVVGGASSYAIRAYRLSGAGNVVRDNVFFGTRRLQYADEAYASLADGGGNLTVDPQFDARGCDGFRPTNPAARRFGRHAR